uniref:Uncharacterized protein n=1 Tax=Chelonoidis abingdonii TaxID=106734 RepID=A0A8C0J9G1_CHEAB
DCKSSYTLWMYVDITPTKGQNPSGNPLNQWLSNFCTAQKFSSSFCIVSSASKEQITTFKQEKILDKKEGEREQFSSELTNSQPDILCSVKVTSDCPTYPNVFESCGEDMHKGDESKPSQSSQIEANQDTLNTKSNFLGLPLSLGFAFQLVDLFGSPGFPLESLLPDDYIVPLDWKTSKKIHLLWKTSVEVWALVMVMKMIMANISGHPARDGVSIWVLRCTFCSLSI